MKAIVMGVAWAVFSGLLAALGMEPGTAKWLGFVCALALGPLVSGASASAGKEA